MKRRGAIYRVLLAAGLVAAIGYVLLHRSILGASLLQRELEAKGIFGATIRKQVFSFPLRLRRLHSGRRRREPAGSERLLRAVRG